MEMEMEITNNNIEEVLKENKIVLVDFWASWCGPCRMLGPTIEEVATEFEGKALVAKCNVDEAEQVALKYGIRSIPTLIYFKDGEAAERSVGVVSKDEIVKTLTDLL